MKSILIIGLGRFGRHMARGFTENGLEVMAVDKNEDRVNNNMQYVTNAQIGDATNEKFLASLGPANFDMCVVAIGDNFQSSLEATSLLKELGAKFVLARASRDVHRKFLLRNGADKVVYAEREVAERLAVKYSNDNIFDYIELTPDYSIYEVQVPESWVEKSILQVSVRSKFQISILAIKVDGRILPMPKPEHVFSNRESIMVLGHNDDVARLLKLK